MIQIDPELLRDAIVLQAVHSAQQQQAFEGLAAQQKQLTETRQSVDALAKDRQEQKQTYEARIAELTELSNANAEALGDVAKHFGHESVDALLAAIKPAPGPVKSEGGEQ